MYALEQSGVETTKEQYAMANVIEQRKELKTTWAASTKGKARRKHRANAKSIEQVRDEASEKKIQPTSRLVLAGLGEQ